MVDIEENLMLFMKLQTLGDRALRKLACSHVIQSIRRMNHKHKNELKNRALQKILFTMLQVNFLFLVLMSLLGRTWMDNKLSFLFLARG